MKIRKAERKKAKLRLAMAGTSGSGKTYSSLLIAFGLGGKVGVIDTEHGSADLYAHLGDYDVIQLDAPYSPARYVEAIGAFEDAGYDSIIIDSLSHAWSGDGGVINKVDQLNSHGGNNFAAWRKVTPEHNALVDAMLQSKSNIIATMRSKSEYVIEENDKGKKVPRKIGLAPVQRDGMEYEFTIFFDVSMDNSVSASKDRTTLFKNRIFVPSIETGRELRAWLDSGVEVVPEADPNEEAMGLLKAGADVGTEFLKIAWEKLTKEQREALKTKLPDLKEKAMQRDKETKAANEQHASAVA